LVIAVIFRGIITASVPVELHPIMNCLVALLWQRFGQHVKPVPATRISAIVNEKRSITVDTALRLSRYFGGDAQSWLNFQQAFDLKTGQAELEEELNYITPMAVMA